MTQQERSGLNEAAEISAHAAGAVRCAIKTGKAVSGAAKGAAAAGPYGAAAAILWTHRKAVAAIIAGLLVLPVLFIMLLPSMIFGGLTKAGVEGSPDTPILNDNAAIVENINQISQEISDLLEEGQEDVRARLTRILPLPVPTRRRSSIHTKAPRPTMPTASLPCTVPPKIRTTHLSPSRIWRM